MRCFADISAINRENKARYSSIIVCITFAQYCTCVCIKFQDKLFTFGGEPVEVDLLCSSRKYLYPNPPQGRSFKVLRRWRGSFQKPKTLKDSMELQLKFSRETGRRCARP